VQYQPPWVYPPPPPTNGMGIAGFVLGLLSVLLALAPGLGFLVGIVGIALSGLGRSRTARAQGMATGLANAGLILAITGTCLTVLVSAYR
jgi:hypothetical protein